LKDFKIKQIIGCFCLDTTSAKTAKLLRIDQNTINKRFNLLREIVLKNGLLKEIEKDEGEIELDESYFGIRRVRKKKRKRRNWKNRSV
jgi:hypothetical protein